MDAQQKHGTSVFVAFSLVSSHFDLPLYELACTQTASMMNMVKT